MKSCVFFLIVASVSLLVTESCRTISVQSDEIGDFDFELAPAGLIEEPNSGRPVYMSETQDGTLYVYHITASTDASGVGRWVINPVLGDKENALAFIDSWSVAPHLVQAVHDLDKAGWVTNRDGEWV